MEPGDRAELPFGGPQQKGHNWQEQPVLTKNLTSIGG